MDINYIRLIVYGLLYRVNSFNKPRFDIMLSKQKYWSRLYLLYNYIVLIYFKNILNIIILLIIIL